MSEELEQALVNAQIKLHNAMIELDGNIFGWATQSCLYDAMMAAINARAAF